MIVSQTFAATPSIVMAAPAKLNLFLEITGKREDGFHNLDTLILAVDLFDTLELTATKERTIRLNCSDSNLPTDARNLVYRAAEKLLPNGGIDIQLTKRIPSEAGMGGGSSDAGSTLMAMNRLMGLNKTHDELNKLAAELGSDVGFFLTPPAGWCTGRGEVVEPIMVKQAFHFVVVKPTVGCPTADVYKRVTVPTAPRNGRDARKALEQGDPEKLAAGMFNRLQEPAFAVAPSVRTVHERLTACRPFGVQVTGSGSAVFALCRDRIDAERVAHEFQKWDERVFVLRGITAETPR